MRTPAASSRRTTVDETYFERKARDLVVPEDEIEAWELNAQDLEGLGDSGQSFGTAGFE